ncbi:mCG147036 [Mus musculus]|jgi:hypothetical protein|nr:mCG147036 [Mus musculus]
MESPNKVMSKLPPTETLSASNGLHLGEFCQRILKHTSPNLKKLLSLLAILHKLVAAN